MYRFNIHVILKFMAHKRNIQSLVDVREILMYALQLRLGAVSF